MHDADTKPGQGAEKRGKQAVKSLERVVLALPIFLAMTLVPLTIGEREQAVHPSILRYWYTPVDVDMNSYYAARVLMVLALAMLLILFFSFPKKLVRLNKAQQWLVGLSAVFALFTVVSTIFAFNRQMALWGIPRRYEGVFVQLSYVVCFYYGILVVRRFQLDDYVRLAVLLLAASVTLIAPVELFMKGLLSQGPLYRLISLVLTPPGDAFANFTGPEMTLRIPFGNPNYMGSYAALAVPMLFALCFDKRSGRGQRLLSAMLIVSITAILLVSRSQAGIVGVATGVLVFAIMNWRFFRMDKRQGVAAALSLMLGLAGAFMVLPESKKHLVVDILDEARILLNLGKKTEKAAFDPYYGLPMYEFKVEGRDMSLSTVDGALKLHTDESGHLDFYDRQGMMVAATYRDEKNAYVLAPPFEKMSYRLEEDEQAGRQLVWLGYEGQNYIFLENNSREGLFLTDDRLNRIEFVHAPHFGFEGKEKIGSSRGYIWSRSIPLLKDTLIKGYGPDNYLAVFPQEDYWGKTYAFSYNVFIIVDKPHNIYLQWGINNGVLALLSLLAAFGLYLGQEGRRLLRFDKQDPMRMFKLGIYCSVAGYLATGMFNDSTVSISPIFWSLLGAGASMMDTGVLSHKGRPYGDA